jgi:hypothetical protein
MNGIFFSDPAIFFYFSIYIKILKYEKNCISDPHSVIVPNSI